MERSLQLPGQPVQRGTMAHEHDVYAMLADAAAAQRDLDGLQQYAPLLEELAARDGHRLYQAVAHRAWGVAARLAGDYAEAGKRLNLALESFQQLGARWQVGRTLAELGELELARSQAVAAREHFTQALAAFEELRAAPDAARVSAALAPASMN